MRPAFVALTLAGALAAATGWDGSAVLIVAGVAGTIATQLTIGILAYRRAMRGMAKRAARCDDDAW